MDLDRQLLVTSKGKKGQMKKQMTASHPVDYMSVHIPFDFERYLLNINKVLCFQIQFYLLQTLTKRNLFNLS